MTTGMDGIFGVEKKPEQHVKVCRNICGINSEFELRNKKRLSTYFICTHNTHYIFSLKFETAR